MNRKTSWTSDTGCLQWIVVLFVLVAGGYFAYHDFSFMGLIPASWKSTQRLVKELRLPYLRTEATVIELARRREVEAVQPLIGILDPGCDPEFCEEVAAALGDIGDARAILPLLRLPGLNLARYKRKAYEDAVARISGDASVPPLIKALADGSPENRVFAAAELGRRRDPRAIQVLLTALLDDNRSVAEAAANALGAIGSPAVEPLLLSLKVTHGADRRWVMVALGATRDQLAISTLRKLLAAGDWDGREWAAEGLGKTQDPSVVLPLISAMERMDSVAAANALAQVGKPAVALLVDKLGHSPASQEIAHVLGKIGEPAIESLAHKFQESVGRSRLDAATALADIRDSRAEETLTSALRTNDLQLVSAAHRFLIRQGDPSSEDRLLQSLFQYGDQEMATDFLNCGNPKLREAAKIWSKRHNYDIIPMLGSRGTVEWGKH